MSQVLRQPAVGLQDNWVLTSQTWARLGVWVHLFLHRIDQVSVLLSSSTAVPSCWMLLEWAAVYRSLQHGAVHRHCNMSCWRWMDGTTMSPRISSRCLQLYSIKCTCACFPQFISVHTNNPTPTARYLWRWQWKLKSCLLRKHFSKEPDANLTQFTTQVG